MLISAYTHVKSNALALEVLLSLQLLPLNVDRYHVCLYHTIVEAASHDSSLVWVNPTLVVFTSMVLLNYDRSAHFCSLGIRYKPWPSMLPLGKSHCDPNLFYVIL